MPYVFNSLDQSQWNCHSKNRQQHAASDYIVLVSCEEYFMSDLNIVRKFEEVRLLSRLIKFTLCPVISVINACMCSGFQETRLSFTEAQTNSSEEKEIKFHHPMNKPVLIIIKMN